ncbi:MAG TPA: HEAT repeat domain-containing protein [Armatimonadota bacterium]|nr:HEAT repeat domain-containing protein [Armatimonadota bacterium]
MTGDMDIDQIRALLEHETDWKILYDIINDWRTWDIPVRRQVAAVIAQTPGCTYRLLCAMLIEWTGMRRRLGLTTYNNIVEALLDEDEAGTTEDLLQLLHNKNHDNVVRSIRLIAGQARDHLRNLVLEYLASSDQHLRMIAASLLAHMHDDFVMSILLEGLTDADWRIQDLAIKGLGSLGGNEVIPHLAGMLKHRNEILRCSTIRALKTIGGADAVALIMTALPDEDDDVRIAAAYALGELKNPMAVGALLQQCRIETDPYVQNKIVDALAEIGTQEAIHALIVLLRTDRDPHLRSSAALHLIDLPSAESCAALVAALDDPGEDVASCAANALSEMPSCQLDSAMHDRIRTLLNSPRNH